MPVDLNNWKALLDPLPMPPHPKEITAESMDARDQQVANVHRMNAMRANLRRIAQSNEMVVDGRTIKLTDEQVTRSLNNLTAGTSPSAEIAILHAIPGDILAQVQELGKQEAIKKEHSTDASNPGGRRPVKDPIVVGGEGEDLEERLQKLTKAQKMLDQPAQSIRATDLWEETLKEVLKPEDYDAYRKGGLAVESAFVNK